LKAAQKIALRSLTTEYPANGSFPTTHTQCSLWSQTAGSRQPAAGSISVLPAASSQLQAFETGFLWSSY
jgi:hypothetical protein